MNKMIPYQRELCQQLFQVINNKDYSDLKEKLEQMDKIIANSNFDEILFNFHFNETLEITGENELSYKKSVRILKTCELALRCTVARSYLQESYREFSTHIADSFLLQWFCKINNFGQIIRVPSKSTLERYEKMLPESLIKDLNSDLKKIASSEKSKSILGLEKPLCLDHYFLDTTCIEANIHYPVDWVLLKDATITLMKAITLIRKQNLKNRMNEGPKDFITMINKLCIKMTHTKHKKNAKKKRKIILRLMKKLLKKVTLHAIKHRDLLINNWKETEYTENQANQIIIRMNNVLEQLPKAILQAHERIIGERQVKNNEKILSLYENQVYVMVRGKANARVEFGNCLLINEQIDGFIVDWDFYRDKIPSDSVIFKPHIEGTINKCNGHSPKTITTDRGFDSKKNNEYQESNGIMNYICPKSVENLKEKLMDENFIEHQKRRASTEGRISILKNNFIGKCVKNKGCENRAQRVAISILTHNIWLLAKLSIEWTNQKKLDDAA
jgi:hypothetical protein